MAGEFPDTRWSLVLHRAAEESERQRATEELCRLYWQPVYAFIRRSGLVAVANPSEIEDLTQGFFVAALQGDLFERAEPEKGRLRSYLLGAVKNYLANERRKEAAQRRGAGISFVHIDAQHEERTQYAGTPQIADDSLPPDQWFDRRWAEGVLELSLRRLREEYATRERMLVYEVLKPLLASDDAERERLQTEAAATLKCGSGALRVALHRFRKRYRELVRDEVMATLCSGDDIDDEIAWLVRVLAAKV